MHLASSSYGNCSGVFVVGAIMLITNHKLLSKCFFHDYKETPEVWNVRYSH